MSNLGAGGIPDVCPPPQVWAVGTVWERCGHWERHRIEQVHSNLFFSRPPFALAVAPCLDAWFKYSCIDNREVGGVAVQLCNGG